MMSKKGLKGIMLVALAPQQGMFLGNWSGLQKKNLGPEQWSSRQSLKTSLGQSSLLLSKNTASSITCWPRRYGRGADHSVSIRLLL